MFIGFNVFLCVVFRYTYVCVCVCGWYSDPRRGPGGVVLFEGSRSDPTVVVVFLLFVVFVVFVFLLLVSCLFYWKVVYLYGYDVYLIVYVLGEGAGRCSNHNKTTKTQKNCIATFCPKVALKGWVAGTPLP